MQIIQEPPEETTEDDNDEFYFKTEYEEVQWLDQVDERIRKAIKERENRLQWSDGDDLGRNAQAPKYLINDILETDAHGIISGSSMSFKTFLCLRLAFSICTGEPFFQHPVFRTGKTLYVCGEGRGALARRIKAMQLAFNDFGGNLMILDSLIKIDDVSDMAKLRSTIEDHNPVLVIFDTLSSLSGNTDENSNNDVSEMLTLIKNTCRNADCSSIGIHHFGKDAQKGSRGASAFKANSDFEFSLVREEGTMQTTLSCLKMKDGDLFDDMVFVADVVDLGLIREDGTTATSLVLNKGDTKPRLNLLSENDSLCLESLRMTIEKDGMPVPEVWRQSEKMADVSTFVTEIDLWRKMYYELTTSPRKTAEKAFLRSREKLVSCGYINIYLQFVWIIK